MRPRAGGAGATCFLLHGEEVCSFDSREFSWHIQAYFENTPQSILWSIRSRMWEISGGECKGLNRKCGRGARQEDETSSHCFLSACCDWWADVFGVSPSHPDAGNVLLSWTDSMLPLLVHQLRVAERVHEGAVVLRVEALVLVDFSLDLFRGVLVVVLLVSGHRLSRTPGNSRSRRRKKISKHCHHCQVALSTWQGNRIVSPLFAARTKTDYLLDIQHVWKGTKPQRAEQTGSSGIKSILMNT